MYEANYGTLPLALFGSFEGRGGFVKKGRKKWKEWRDMRVELWGFTFLHNTKSL
jgi:hypothetical protein